jgi:hypothetical protein
MRKKFAFTKSDFTKHSSTHVLVALRLSQRRARAFHEREVQRIRFPGAIQTHPHERAAALG